MDGLHHQHGARLSRWINPKEGVIDSGPGDRPTGAAGWERFAVDSKSQAKLDPGTGNSNRVASKLRYQAVQLNHTQVANLVFAHLLHGPRTQHPLAVQRAAAQQHAF